MVASVLCHLCQPVVLPIPGFKPTEPPHHYGQRMAQTTPGLLGGWECRCDCSKADKP